MHTARLFRARLVAVAGALFLGATALTAPAGAGTRADTTPGVVYFFMADNGTENRPGPYLVPVARDLDRVIPATTALRSLLAGPTTAEHTAVPAISTAIPAGTTLNSVSITGGVATVDLSAEFVSGGGSASMMGRLHQVVWTLTQFATVDSVRFRIDGTPTTVFGGEGIIVADPVGRADMDGLLPAILLESPSYGGPAGSSSVRVRGLADTFEATFLVGVYDGDGRELARAAVTASAWMGTHGTFDATIPYLPGEGTAGSIIVWEASPKDGSQINVREYPITLGRGVYCGRWPATMLGTAGRDRLIGTPGDDVIVGFGGGDRIEGRGGDDVLCGNAGRDFLIGGPGDDRLYGQGGADRLAGGTGFDWARGGPDPDRCVAEFVKGC